MVAALAVTTGVHASELVLVALTLSLYASAGLYRPHLSLSVLDEIPALCGRVVVAAALTFTLSDAIKAFDVSHRLVWAVVALTLASVASRGLCYSAVRWARRTGRVGHETLIVGAGRVGARLASLLDEHHEYGLRPVGFIDDNPLLSGDDLPIPIVAAPTDLSTALVEHRIQVVIVSFSSLREHAMVDILRTCDRLRCEIFFVPRLYEMQAIGRDIEDIWGLPLVRLRRSPYRSIAWKFKRGFDILVSGVTLTLLAPLMVACSIAVRIEGPGVLFRQTRVGLDGRPFELLKFRSLRPVDNDESSTRWSIAGDARMGRVGRLLRKTSLDELPQLWNILRGDMTLVGPRPERPYFVDEYSRSMPRYMARHRVPAGLTGWAQVHGLRGDTSIEERAQFDNRYIENWSLWSDAKILLRTVAAVLRGTGS